MGSMDAIILVGGRGLRLKSLTKNKTKSFVSFFGKYRIIDFPLSSLSNSQVKNVGILTQYEPYDLMRYVGSGSSWDLDVFNEGVSFLTPYESEENNIIFQKGTANACLSQIEYIKKSSAEYILILSGDQIYKMDFKEVLSEHIKHNAKLTIITADLDKEKDNLSRFGIIEYDASNRIISFEEKPKNPKSNHISLGMYLFNKDFLLKYLPKADTLCDFGKDLIPYIISESKDVYAFKHDSWFFDVGTVESLYNANMFFLEKPTEIAKKGDTFKVYSKPFDFPPNAIWHGGRVTDAIVSDACVVYGRVKHSVLSFKCKVDKGSKIEDSILLPKVFVGKNVKIKNAIVDEDLVIPDGMELVFDTPTIVDSSSLKR